MKSPKLCLPFTSCLFYLIFLFAFANRIQAQSQHTAVNKILVFSKTSGFRHGPAIKAGKAMFTDQSAAHQFLADTTEDAAVFTPENLKQYKAIVFLNTTGDILNEAQQNAFKSFIQHGGGFVGIHAATDTEYDWPWYNQLVGAYFDSHPKPQAATFRVLDKSFPAINHLPDSLHRKEEIYNFKSVQKGLHYLIDVDETSYEGGKMGADHPIAWEHEFDGGRAFYVEWGHFPETFQNPSFEKLIYKALDWSIKK